MERAVVDGVALAYEIVGQGEPVMFIHGGFVADALRPLLAEPTLAGRYRLLRYHRRGYGESDRPPGLAGIDRQAADGTALLRHLGIKRAHVVGHSYGGCVALQLALDAPDAVASLVLLEPALMIGTSGPSYREALARGTERFRAAGAVVAIDEALAARSPGYRPLLDRLLPDAFAQAVTDAETAFERDIGVDGLLAWSFSDEAAARVDCPALSVLGGRSEALWPRFGEVHRWLLAHLPRSEGIVVPDAMHLLPLERPRATAEAIASFVARHPIVL
jgi:pimeloyl-ACP methyl ester carboxylesterase